MTEQKGWSTRIIGALVAALVLISASTSWLALFSYPDVARAQSRAVTDVADDEFGRRVRDYILKNPDVVLDALRLIEKRKQTAVGDETKATIAAHRKEIFDDPASPIGGNPVGEVAIVEFFDYNCPYCRRVAPVLAEAEKADPGLRFVYKEWPILGPNSTFAARAALATVKQGKYVAFHKAMMTTTGVINDSKVIEIATMVGLDVKRLKKDMDDPEISAAIERNHALAAELRITGTPSFVVGEQILRGALDLSALQARIREARAKR